MRSRKIKGKKKMNSVNGGRKFDEDEAKKEKREKQRSGGHKFWPPHLNSVNPQKKKYDEISFGMD